MSLVDGYSLPFKLEISGGECTRTPEVGKPVPFTGMDCSGLSLSQCPTEEIINGKLVSLQGVDPKTHKKVGCFSPCQKLVDDKWQTHPVAPDSAEAGPYCCAGKFGTPDKCRNGPMTKSKYLDAVRHMCKVAYAYAYDDMIATISCSATTEYKLTYYCPNNQESEVIV
jgi:hypothetical protein